METGAILVGALGLVGFLCKAGPVCVEMLRPRFLAEVQAGEAVAAGRAPRVSVIVPACNEEASIKRCLQTLLRQDTPDLEIIAVDDRSTDRTGALMEAVAAGDPRVRVEHISELPDGWLGKNHANQVGAAGATGKWILFTDGDVFFKPDCIRLAVAHVEAERLDHLTLLPGLVSAGYWEMAACCFFGGLLAAYLKPWHVRNPLRPASFTGVGAFNLVRRGAYRAIGEHRRLALEVADDLKLGKLLKQAGFVSDVLAGWPHVELRWQVGLRGVIRGLEKNGFAGAEYRVGRVVTGVLTLIVVALLPVAGVVLAPGWTRVVYAVWLVGEIWALSIPARQQGFSRLAGLAFPVVCLVLAYAVARSAVLTLWRGGIVWRGTFYRLADLKRGLV